MRTSCACSYLLQNIVELFVGWIRADFEPRVRVAYVAVEDIAERFHAVPAGVFPVIGGDYDMRPAVHVGNCLERQGKARPRPGNAHHRVVGLRIVKVVVAAPLWKERTIPIGRDVAAGYAHCTQHTQQIIMNSRDKQSSVVSNI